MTVFLTTHYLDEADALSNRVIVFDHGRVVTADTPDRLKEQIAGDLVEMEVSAPEQLDAAVRILEKSTADQPSVTGLRVVGRVPRPGPPSRPSPVSWTCSMSNWCRWRFAARPWTTCSLP